MRFRLVISVEGRLLLQHRRRIDGRAQCPVLSRDQSIHRSDLLRVAAACPPRQHSPISRVPIVLLNIAVLVHRADVLMYTFLQSEHRADMPLRINGAPMGAAVSLCPRRHQRRSKKLLKAIYRVSSGWTNTLPLCGVLFNPHNEAAARSCVDLCNPLARLNVAFPFGPLSLHKPIGFVWSAR